MKITPLVAGVMKVAVFSAAFAIPGTAMASASIIPDQSTSGNGSILGGNAINLPVSAPIDVCGNGVGVLGTALGGCSGGASVNNSGGSGSGGVSQHSSGNGSIGGGNVINAPVSAPVDVCGLFNAEDAKAVVAATNPGGNFTMTPEKVPSSAPTLGSCKFHFSGNPTGTIEIDAAPGDQIAIYRDGSKPINRPW